MKADISLAERQQLEHEQQAEIRAMLAPRHFQTMQDQMALDTALARLELEQLRQAAPVMWAIMGRTAVEPEPVVKPEPEPAPPPTPVAIRPSGPDLPYDLRFHIGLR